MVREACYGCVGCREVVSVLIEWNGVDFACFVGGQLRTSFTHLGMAGRLLTDSHTTYTWQRYGGRNDHETTRLHFLLHVAGIFWREIMAYT